MYTYPKVRAVDHIYDGLPSVTRILRETADTKALDEWRERVGEEEAKRISRESAALGTRVHKMLECQLRGMPLPKHDPMEWIMFRAIADYGLRDITEVWATEQAVAVPGEYGGTADFFGVYDGVPVVIDFKTGNRPKARTYTKDWMLQLAAYAHASNMTAGTDIKQGVIFYTDREGNFQSFQMWDLEKPLKAFYRRLKKYRALYPLGRAKPFPFTPQELGEEIDDRDGVPYWRKPGMGRPVGKPAGVVNGRGYRQVGVTWDGVLRRYYWHRLAYYLHTGEQPPIVDHIDGNRANNHISNLRGCTHKDNLQFSNVRKYRKAREASRVAPFPGVQWHKGGGAWGARVKRDGKFVLEKSGYATASDAAWARYRWGLENGEDLPHPFYSIGLDTYDTKGARR